MGCDWNVFVQGLFEVEESKDNNGADDGKQKNNMQWVNLTNQESKTGCGGNPVRYVLQKYIEACNTENMPTAKMMGSYGSEFPIQDATFDGSNHWSITQPKEELDNLEEIYDSGTGEVKPKKQKKEGATGRAKKEYLEPAEVLEKRGKLLRKIESKDEKIKKYGLIEGYYPECECFHMSIAEFQGFCDALLNGEYAYTHYDTYASLLEWTDVLENFQRDPPSTSRVSEESMSYIKYRFEKRNNKEEYEECAKEEVKDWKVNLENNKVVKQMMPQISDAIGCKEEQVGSHILGFCGNSSPPVDLRFTIFCEEGHLEFFEKATCEAPLSSMAAVLSCDAGGLGIWTVDDQRTQARRRP